MNSKRLVLIQYARAAAALMVVVNHSDGAATGMSRLFTPESWACGVDIFFVISGFIIYYVSAGKRGHTLDFIFDRVARVVPIYWIFTALTAISVLMVPGLFNRSAFSISHTVLSFLFIPHVNPNTGGTSPILGIGWTLIYEMHFYVLFSIGLAFFFNRRAIFTSLVLMFLVLLSYAVDHADPILQFYFNNVWLEFVYGMALCALYRAGKLQLSASASLALLIAGGAGFIGAAYAPYSIIVQFREIVWGLPAAAVVAGVLGLNQLGYGRDGLMNRIGNSSYSLYLSHLFVMGLMRAMWQRLHLPVSGALADICFIVVTLMASTVVGLAVHRLIERPLTDYLKGRTLVLRQAMRPRAERDAQALDS